MSVHDADLGDLYVDAQGKLWRCVALCREPTFHFEEVEPPVTVDGPEGSPGYAPKHRINGGVSGLMWNGFRRIYRPSETGRAEVKR